MTLSATEAEEPLARSPVDSEPEDSVETDWYARPWRERVQAADVAIAGIVVVVVLVAGLAFFLTRSSPVKGLRPLVAGEFSASPKPHHGSPGSGDRTPTTPSSSSSVPASSPGASASTTQPATPAGSSSSSTSASPSSRPSGSAAAAGSPPALCAPGDLTISTVTDSTSYSIGGSVVATTRIVANTTCVFAPVAAGQYSCPATVVFVNPVGTQVYPLPGQSEQCAGVAGGTLVRGATRTVQVSWTQAPAGQYSAMGTWYWNTGGGSTYEGNAPSAPFMVGP